MKKQKEKKESKKSSTPFLTMANELSRIRKQEKKDIEYHREPKEPKTLQEKQQETKREKTSAVLKGIQAKAEQLSSFDEGLTKKRLLKKPTAKVPVVASSKLIKQFGSSGYRMFQSEGHNFQPQDNPIQDNRSMLFQNEYNKERKRMFL